MTSPSTTSLSSEPAPSTAAVYGVFIASGFAFASWASRIPQVRDRLELDPARLGLVLLAIAVGSVLAMPLSGVVITRIGEGRTVAATSVLMALGTAIAAVGSGFGVAPVLVGLFLLGFGNGSWDVAMNVQAAAVERRLGRVIMPRFHAGWSVGTVAGALIGSAMIALGVPVPVHLCIVAVLVALGVPLATRGFLPRIAPDRAVDAAATTRSRSPLRAWTEPRTVIVGVFVLCVAFTEGTGNDWLSVAMIDGYHAAPALGSLTFAVFVAAMTVGRWFGPSLMNRHHRVPVLRVSAVVALAGLLITVFGGSVPVAILGTALWGAGTALGFPAGMSAAADDPAFAAGRVSVVASIGYVAFLGGPPLIGFLGDRIGVLRGLLAAAALLALALGTSGALRPPEPVRPGDTVGRSG